MIRETLTTGGAVLRWGLLLATLCGGCRQEVLSETFHPLGPSMHPAPKPSTEEAIPVAGRVSPTMPRAQRRPTFSNWLKELFAPSAPTAPTAPAAPRPGSPTVPTPAPYTLTAPDGRNVLGTLQRSAGP